MSLYIWSGAVSKESKYLGEINLNNEEYIPLSGGNSIRKYKCFTMWKNGAIKVQFNQKINLNSRELWWI